LVTKGKRGSVDARRQVRRWITQRDLIKKLFDEVAPRFQERAGGYLRILKLGPRPGDGAEMAILQWVDFELDGGDKKAAAKAEKEAKATGSGEKKAAKPAKEKTSKPAKEKAAPKAPAKRGGKGAAPSTAEPGKKRPAGRKAPSGG
jgi:large subunit ribosomal protein L17